MSWPDEHWMIRTGQPQTPTRLALGVHVRDCEHCRTRCQGMGDDWLVSAQINCDKARTLLAKIVTEEQIDRALKSAG